MISLLLALVFALPTIPATQDSTVNQEIPPLDNEGVKAILLFSLDNVEEDELVVEEIKVLHDRAKASVRIKGRTTIVALQCRLTDFGPRWGLEGSEAESIQPAGQEATATAPQDSETGAPSQTIDSEEPEIQPAGITKNSFEYQRFLIGFANALRDGREDSFAYFYFRDSDFELKQVEGTPEEALARVAGERTVFIDNCRDLSNLLRRYQRFNITSVVATGIPARVFNDLKTWMPDVQEFFSAATIDLELDGNPGSIVLDGIARLSDGWRIGVIADFQLPEPESEPR